jgi:cytoskeletal protein RodZ
MEKSRAEALLTVGQILKSKRTSLKLTLSQVELDTKIRGKYLTRIEADDYADLPNDIYTKGFVSKYADYLGLDAPEIMAKYAELRGGAVAAHQPAQVLPVTQRRWVLTPRLIVAATLGIVVLGVLGYLGWQFTSLAAAPDLQLTTPASDQTVNGNLITIAGHVGNGADVLVNQSPLLTDGNGNFSSELGLQQGVNTITITAQNKLGKTTTITRNILVQQGSNVLVPTATFDGIAVGITIKGKATGMTVLVDNQQVFHGTMLVGTTQTFKGTGLISVTTDNGGATDIVVTNSVVSSKDLGAVGANGETKRNLEFAKDTKFQ